MKKLAIPIIYFISLFPLTGITIGIEAIMRSEGWLGPYEGFIDLSTFVTFIVSLIVIGVPVFWVVNMLIRRIENSQELRISDHLRQSSIFYLAGTISLIFWVINGFGNSEEDGYLLLWMGISSLGILVNYIYLQPYKKA